MKLASRLFLLLSAVLFILSAAMFVRASEDRARAKDSGRTADAGTAGESSRYFIRSENGRVMLYTGYDPENGPYDAYGGTAAPRELDIRYADLPPEDRELLDRGMTVEDERQLLSVLEDYTN